MVPSWICFCYATMRTLRLVILKEMTLIKTEKIWKMDKKKKKIIPRVPVMAQWKQIQLGTMRLHVQSLPSISRLRIWHCCELWCRSQMLLGSCVAVAAA